MKIPFAPMEYFEQVAKEVWWPMFKGDALDPNIRQGWSGLCYMAKDLGVSTKGHRWNCRKSRMELAKKLLRMKLRQTREQWSRDVSAGKFDHAEHSAFPPTKN